ncbi:hypothetical protein [uncultured Thiohalocapsa sp.]|uniref:hypothetical protein n=1 Tax=uncultured Thiohalocapsa sp. TaxID=768990 RepID=UPI0025D244C3|nr:hypothetical protein [uncultured Thiohalocapsa sp.]
MPASQAPDAPSMPPKHAAHGAELVAAGPDGGGCMAGLKGRAGPARLLLIEALRAGSGGAALDEDA